MNADRKAHQVQHGINQICLRIMFIKPYDIILEAVAPSARVHTVVTTTTERFKSGSRVKLGNYFLLDGLGICLLLESSARFGAKYNVKTAKDVR